MSTINDEFIQACDYVSSEHSELSQELLVRLYGYYKQATIGQCNAPKPWVFDFISMTKWKSWSQLKDMSKTEAMRQYVQTLNGAVENWNTKDCNTQEKSNACWVSVSTMCKETELSESDKDIFDWVKEGDLNKLKQYKISAKNLRDEQGLTLLHWAVDRGHVDIVKYLMEDEKVDVNCRDDEQQTPLHFAAACGHVEICRLLIEYGADTKAKDVNGFIPKNVAEAPDVLSFLSSYSS